MTTGRLFPLVLFNYITKTVGIALLPPHFLSQRMTSKRPSPHASPTVPQSSLVPGSMCETQMLGTCIEQVIAGQVQDSGFRREKGLPKKWV